VATLDETAVPGFVLEAWLGIAAPAGTPPEVVARLTQAIREITEMPDVRNRMAAMAQTIEFRGGDDYRAQLLSDHQKFGAIIRDAGIEPN
jgi:tripartite-type tricarboxylate transporter receptor subunit TctC